MKILKIISLILIFLSSILDAKTIIWDLGDTLFTTSRFRMAYNIGIYKFLTYSILDLKSPNIQPIINDILNKIDPPENYKGEIATDRSGEPLPSLINKWLAGLVLSKDLIKSINDYIDQLDQRNFFISLRQKELVKRTFEAMFDPKTLVSATYPLDDGIKLLERCYKASDKHGNPKNTLLVLSNWDEISFKELKERYANIFDKYFNPKNVVVSGAIGLIKPEKEAFKYILKNYKLDPKDCIFIDDQYDNILAAQSVGITSLLLCRGNYQTLEKILEKLNVL